MLWEDLGAKWGTPGPWEVQTEVAVIALNPKVVGKFLKVCAQGEGARQDTRPQRPVSPLLCPLLILSSFLSFNLSQVFFFFFLHSVFFPSSSLLCHFQSFPSCFPLSFSLLPFYCLSLYLSLSPCISHFSLPLPFSVPFSFFCFFPFTLFLSNFFSKFKVLCKHKNLIF